MLQPPQVFTLRGSEAFFSCAGTLGCTICLSPSCNSPFTCTQMWDILARQLPACHASLLPQFPVSTPPTSLDECFFNSLVIGLTCSLILWEFWLFFVFKLVVILLLVMQGCETYLCMSPSWPEALLLSFNQE